MTNAEPVAVVGFGTGIDDAGWARKTAAVRDALFRTRPVLPDPVALLRCGGGADLAAMAGFCAQAAVRRTPLLLDGMAVTAAALVAERLAPGARQWWQAGHRSTEPGHALALAELGLEPIVDLRMRLGEGTGAAVALPVLRAAVAALSSMATFTEAGVSDRPPRPRDAFAGNGFRVRTVLPVPACRRAPMGRGAMTALPVVGAALGALAAAVDVGRGAGVRPVQPAVRTARRDGAAAGDPRPAHRRRRRYGRRAGLLRAAAARAGGDARRVDRAVRRGGRRAGDRAAGAGVFGAAAQAGIVDRGVSPAGWPRCWRVADRCRRPTGSALGARVAGTQPSPVVAAWVAVLVGVSLAAGPRLWQGPVAVLAGAVLRRGAGARTACAGSAASPATCWAPPSS